jgi:uncharacterized protein (TIGR02679 family)
LQRSGVAPSLRDALEQLDGPIENPAAARLRLETLWSSVVDDCVHPELVRFVRTPEGAGLLKRLARQDTIAGAKLCRDAEAVLRHLPAKGIARSQLAARALGDAHALDSGQPVATIVLAVQRRHTVGDHAILPAEYELARPALFLNLPANGVEDDSWHRGEPAFLTLRALLRKPPSWDVADLKVHVCENPNLVAIAADALGPDCAPLVCLEGMPAAAQQCLLSQLSKARARLCYHGDFDWPGLRIANYVLREFGAEPWRFTATDYVAAIRSAPNLGKPLKGKPIVASWDPTLAATLQQFGTSIDEEAIASSLLQDLDSRSA